MTTLELKDIMAPIEVIFKQRVTNLIAAGDKGRVLFAALNENLTDTYRITNFKSAVFELDTTTYGEIAKTLGNQIKNIFGDGVKEVILLEYKTTFASVATLAKEKIKWDWAFSTDPDSQSDIAALGKEIEKFTFCYNQKADSKFVVSINNPSATLNDDTVIEAEELLPYVIGVLAGCPYDKSVTYKVFDKLKSVEMPSTIEKGFLTLYSEDEGVRIATPINTLVTTGENDTEDMKSIAIVEGMKRIKDDLIYAFRTGYKGRYKNNYDNQSLFFSAAKYYISELEELRILDSEYNNTVDVDIEALKELWEAQGKDTTQWDDLTAKKTTYKNLILAKMDVKLLDAIEGMQLTVQMY